MEARLIKRTVDLTQDSRQERGWTQRLMLTGAVLADRLQLTVLMGGEPTDLQGVTAVAYFKTPDGAVAVKGTINGAQIDAEFPAEAYAHEGSMTLVVYLSDGNRDMPLYQEVFVIGEGRGDVILDPQKLIPDMTAIVAMMDQVRAATSSAGAAAQAANEAASSAQQTASNAAAQAVSITQSAARDAKGTAESAGYEALRIASTAASGADNAAENANNAAGKANTAAAGAEKWTNAEATASQLAAGSEPTVVVTEKSGKKLITFGIPKGDKGDKGDSGYSIHATPISPAKPGGDDAYYDLIEAGLLGAGVKVGDLILHTGTGDVYVVDAFPPNTNNASLSYKGNIKGPQGDTGLQGPAGTDGFSPTIDVSKTGKITTLTITDKNGPKTAQIRDGEDGQGGSGEGNGKAIINVPELPVDNIRDDVFYRVVTAAYYSVNDKYEKIPLESLVCYVVETLPEIGEPATDATGLKLTSYYALDTGEASGYVTEELGMAFGIPAGWYPVAALFSVIGQSYGGIVGSFGEMVEKATVYLLIESTVKYQENGEWEKLQQPSTIRITVDETGKFVSDTPFEYALAMSEHELQNSLIVRLGRGIYDFPLTVLSVCKVEAVDSIIGFHVYDGYDVDAPTPSMANIIWAKNGITVEWLPQLPRGNTFSGGNNLLYYDVGSHKWLANAHASVSSEGAGWFQKDVYVGGTSQADAKKLATEEYVQNYIEETLLGGAW